MQAKVLVDCRSIWRVLFEALDRIGLDWVGRCYQLEPIYHSTRVLFISEPTMMTLPQGLAGVTLSSEDQA